jgi:hypothetical protein
MIIDHDKHEVTRVYKVSDAATASPREPEHFMDLCSITFISLAVRLYFVGRIGEDSQLKSGTCNVSSCRSTCSRS